MAVNFGSDALDRFQTAVNDYINGRPPESHDNYSVVAILLLEIVWVFRQDQAIEPIIYNSHKGYSSSHESLFHQKLDHS